MTLLKALAGTLICNYKDIEQEIVHTLLMEEYGVSKTWVIIMDKRQDKNAASTPIEIRTFGSGSLLCQEFRRRREETVWKWRRTKTRESSLRSHGARQRRGPAVDGWTCCSLPQGGVRTYFGDCVDRQPAVLTVSRLCPGAL